MCLVFRGIGGEVVLLEVSGTVLHRRIGICVDHDGGTHQIQVLFRNATDLWGVAVGDGAFMGHEDVQGGVGLCPSVHRAGRRTRAAGHDQQQQKTSSKPNH